MRIPLIWAACLGLASAIAPVGARAASPEAKVKAVYLYKMASFVRWPASVRQHGTFRICVAGRTDVAAVLRSVVRGQQIDAMAIEVQVTGARDTGAAASCQILYFGNLPDTARALTTATEGRPVLTVGDRDNGTRGGVIDFLLQDGQVRFIVDAGRARSRGLEMSSKLLDAAVAVAR